MDERRRSPRTQCRLRCRVRTERHRFEARLLDASEGGLCVLAPTAIRRGERVAIEIDVPNRRAILVEATAWHARTQHSKATRRTFFSIGFVLDRADDGFASLLGGASPSASALRLREPTAPDDADATAELEADADAIGLRAFRVRTRAPSGPRTRLLSIAAQSEKEARLLALADLEAGWSVVEIAEAR